MLHASLRLLALEQCNIVFIPLYENNLQQHFLSFVPDLTDTELVRPVLWRKSIASIPLIFAHGLTWYEVFVFENYGCARTNSPSSTAGVRQIVIPLTDRV